MSGVHNNAVNQNKHIPETHKTEKLDSVSQTNDHIPDFTNQQRADTMSYKEDYDPKYGGKSFFELPGLKRIKHRISFSGTVIVLLVCYLVYQQFGSSRKSLETGEVKDGDIRFGQGLGKQAINLKKAPTFRPAPVHLRPGYVPPPNQDQPDQQPPYHNRNPNQDNVDRLEHQQRLKEAYEKNKENLFIQHDSRDNHFLDSNLENNEIERDNEDDFANAKPNQQFNQYKDQNNVNPGVNARAQELNNRMPDKNNPPFKNQFDANARPLGNLNEGKEANDGQNRVQMVDRPAENVHDFHALKQKYQANKEPQLPDRDLSQYKAAGQAALEKQQQQRQQNQARVNVPNPNQARVNAPNPMEELMIRQSNAENIRPHPKQWPVRILKEPDIGCLAGVELLILVHTHPSTFGTRRAIRNSWGVQTLEKYPKLGNYLRWKTIFILGKDGTKQWQMEVDNEHEEFHDILQADFTDNQYEGTRKFLVGMSWLTRNLAQDCEPLFVLKTEENIYHNMNSILGWLEAKFETSSSGIYMGKKLTKDLPIRDARDPYYVSWQEYPQTYFPDMIQGPEFLFDYATYKLLAKQIQSVTKVAMEEGYISLLADHAGVKPTHNEHFILLEQTSNICHMLRMFFVSDVKPSEHKKIFRDTKEALRNGKCPNAHILDAGNRQVNIEM